MRGFLIAMAAVMLCAGSARADWRRGLVLNGVDEDTEVGSIGNIKTVAIWVNLATTTEDVIDCNGTAKIEVIGGVLTATGWTSPSLYVDGAAGSNVTASAWHLITVASDTAVNASAFVIGSDGAAFGELSWSGVLAWNRALSAAEVAGLYNETVAITNDGTSVEMPRRWIGGTNGVVLDLDVPEIYDTGDTVQEVLDVSGSGNHGTLEPSPSTGPTWISGDGTREGVYDFDGSSQYLTANGAATALQGAEQGSISVWLWKAAGASVGDAVMFGSSLDNHQINCRWGGSSNLVFSLRDDDNIPQSKWTLGVTGPFSAEAWHHVVFVQDGVEPVVYVDGTKPSQAFSTSNDKTYWVADYQNSTEVNRLSIGRFYNAAASQLYWDGYLDDIRIYDTALTSNQVANLYAGIDPTNTPVLYMPFDYASGELLNNGSAGGTATVVGTPDVSGAVKVPPINR